MTIFLENPIPIIFLGVAIEAMLAIALVRTGQGRLLVAMIGVFLLTVAGVLVEHFVVTDFEQVETTLDSVAKAVENNDKELALSFVSSSADSSARSFASFILDSFEFSLARISQLEITVNPLTSPPTATAKFLGVGTFKDRVGIITKQTKAAHLKVSLRLEGERWMITTIEDDIPRG